MAVTPDFLSLTPMIPAGENLQEGVAYYVDKLGFSVMWQDGDMAAVTRGAVTLHLVRNSDRAWAENCSCSIGVSDLNELYADYQRASAPIGPLETKPWGRLEFHLILPSGVCLQFFESGKELGG